MSSAWAQTGRIEGTVLASDIGTPLLGVNVSVEGTKLGAATAANGAFVMDDVPAGTHTLRASLLGYRTAQETVEVADGETVRLVIELVEQPIEIAEVVVERVMMTGGRRGLDEIPGSAYYVTPQQLERFSHKDIHRVLRDVPGVSVQEEDGYGQRPNIGMRGTGSERSSKITVMEDGVLIAPAPYAAPAAYYFPTVGRMQGVEVRKGSSQIKYGPYTTGGALNLISTQIPQSFAGKADLLAGEHGGRTVHAYVGDSFRNVGFLVETFQDQVDGFKELDGGGSTGYTVQDYLAKLRFNTSPGARVYQALTLKAGWTNERSDETYLGLTSGDFSRTPFRRYAGSQEDVLDTEHRQFQARHVIRPLSFLDVTTTLYRTDFARNWYKLDRVRASEEGDRISIDALLDDPETYAAEYAIVTGATSPNGNALEVKANNRSYYAQGVQATIGLTFDGARRSHEVEWGVRLHKDEIDRFQWVDLYRMEAGVMTRTEAGTPGTESNRVETANALASFVQYRATLGALTVTPGLRYEHIRLRREDFGKADTERLGTDLSTRENTVDVWIPGIGAEYEWTRTLSTFAGIHKGFAPPGSREGTEPESSVNYEAGVRYRHAMLNLQGVAFFNDYSNLLGSDLAASGGQGTGSLFNGGEADVRGLELLAAYNLGHVANWRVSVPVQLTYTYTDARFRSAFESEFEPWGTVQPGDALPYVPEHQLAASLGVETAAWGVHLSAQRVGTMRTEAGQGAIPANRRIDAHTVLDVAAEYRVVRQARVFLSVRNVTDEVYVVARRPAGLRPGLPRTVQLGLKTRF